MQWKTKSQCWKHLAANRWERTIVSLAPWMLPVAETCGYEQTPTHHKPLHLNPLAWAEEKQLTLKHDLETQNKYRILNCPQLPENYSKDMKVLKEKIHMDCVSDSAPQL